MQQSAHGQSMMHTETIKSALIKLLAATLILAASIAAIIGNPGSSWNGILGGLIVIVIFPSTLLLGIDASRVIKRENPSHRPLRILGKTLGVPQGVFGVILMGFGVVFPIITVRDLIDGKSYGGSAVASFLYLCMAVTFLFVGYHYVKESLWLFGVGRKPE
jgi:hypothetical protein